MNDDMKALRVKTEEALQQFFCCLESCDTSISQLEEKLEAILKQTSDILKQNNEIIAQNNELLNQIKILMGKANIQKESLVTSNEETLSAADEEVEKNDEPVTDGQFTSFEEQIAQTQTEIEELLRKKEEEEKKKTEPEKDEDTEIIKQKEAPTSSVLEFFHKRVAKDNLTNNNLQPLVSSKADNTQDLTKQVREEVKTAPEKKQRSIAEQFEDKTNKDLLSAIGVSEKFMFINDLFSGNIKEYTSFVNELNSKLTLTDSMNIMSSMQLKKKWAKGSLAYTTLENIIIKRFE